MADASRAEMLESGREANMTIFRTAVREGEDMNQAIARASHEANQRGYSGYEIVCEKCGQPVRNHERPEDCETWTRELGVQRFEP